MKKYPRTVIYDRLHKSVVCVCIGISLYGSLLIGEHVYTYFRYVRPQIQAAKEAAKQELLLEGVAEKLVKE